VAGVRVCAEKADFLYLSLTRDHGPGFILTSLLPTREKGRSMDESRNLATVPIGCWRTLLPLGKRERLELPTLSWPHHNNGCRLKNHA
jgi:hypothetical protein